MQIFPAVAIGGLKLREVPLNCAFPNVSTREAVKDGVTKKKGIDKFHETFNERKISSNGLFHNIWLSIEHSNLKKNNEYYSSDIQKMHTSFVSE